MIADPVERPGEHRYLRQIERRPAGTTGAIRDVLLEPARELRCLRRHRARNPGQRQDEEQHRHRERDGGGEDLPAAEPLREPCIPRREQRAEQRGPYERLPQRRDDLPDQPREQGRECQPAHPHPETPLDAQLCARGGRSRSRAVVHVLAHDGAPLRIRRNTEVACLRLTGSIASQSASRTAY